MTPYHGSLVAAVALVALALASTTTRRASSPIARRSDPRRQTPHDRPSQAFWDHRPRARPRPAVLGHRAFAWRCFVYANGGQCTGTLTEVDSVRSRTYRPREHRHRLRRVTGAAVGGRACPGRFLALIGRL